MAGKVKSSYAKTPEDLLAVAKAFTEKDPDGNGKSDTYGLTLNADSQRVLSHMFGFGNPEKYAVVDGKLTFVWDRIQDWLQFTKQIVDAKVVDPDFLLDKGDKALTDFTNGKIGIFLTGKFSQLNSPTFANFKRLIRLLNWIHLICLRQSMALLKAISMEVLPS